MFGLTSDQGAVRVTLYHDDDRLIEYAGAPEGFRAILQKVRDHLQE